MPSQALWGTKTKVASPLFLLVCNRGKKKVTSMDSQNPTKVLPQHNVHHVIMFNQSLPMFIVNQSSTNVQPIITKMGACDSDQHDLAFGRYVSQKPRLLQSLFCFHYSILAFVLQCVLFRLLRILQRLMMLIKKKRMLKMNYLKVIYLCCTKI